MRLDKSRGIIINRTKLRDADLYLTIFTADRGKLSLFARSGRKITSTRATKLDLFTLISFGFIEKNNRLTLTSVDLVNSFRDSKESLTDISRLFQIGELVDALLPENEPNSHIFEILETALTNLHRFNSPEYLKRYKIRLLRDLGYGDVSGSLQDIDRRIESIIESPLKTSSLI